MNLNYFKAEFVFTLSLSMKSVSLQSAFRKFSSLKLFFLIIQFGSLRHVPQQPPVLQLVFHR